MKLSHSKLATILNDPMTYYLSYVQGISKKEEKTALWIGSAVHWGIEHNTDDLTEYFKEKGTFRTKEDYTRDHLLSEAMVHGYLKHKDEIFDQILTNPADGSKLTLVNESHEVFMNAKLKSFVSNLPHEFVGIIDLLLLTNQGFVIIDYKTSTYEPDWNNYLDQIYRYIFLLRSEFPDVPVVKIGIVNLRKSAIRQKKTENYEEFLRRLKFEYEVNDENYVNYHEFRPESLDETLLDKYIENLSRMADTAAMIDEKKLFYINYGAQCGQYGKSDFYDIIYHTPDAYVLYKISDDIWNPDNECFDKSRDCVGIDMEVVDHSNVLNKYSIFEKESEMFADKSSLFKHLKTNYICDDTLLDRYWETKLKKVEKLS